MALNIEEIKNNLVNQILLNFPTAEVGAGSMIRDIMVDPQSTQINLLSEEIDKISYLSTFVENADNITDEDLDSIGANYGVSRDNGRLSRGIITFQSTSRPTEKITIGAEDGTGGISVRTISDENGNSYEFTTTETVYMDIDATYNEEHKCYEVSAPIQSSTLGSLYNVGVGTITVLVKGISNITGCYNYIPTTGGTDRQNNTEYALDIQSAILGSSKNIVDGINNIIKSIDGVEEIKTLHPNSEQEPTEPGFSLTFVKGTIEKIVENFSINYDGINFEYDLSKKPVTRIISVVATVKGVEKTLINGIDYTLQDKKDSIYNDTIYSSDKIVFLKTSDGTPDAGSDVYITFAYNSLIEDCQNKLKDSIQDYLVLGNLLVAQANPVLVKFSTNIKLKYNYNTEAVKTNIITGISNYITNLKLGEDFTSEQLYAFIATEFSDSISTISYPFTTFRKQKEEKNTQKIEFTFGEYASIDENSINITFE